MNNIIPQAYALFLNGPYVDSEDLKSRMRNRWLHSILFSVASQIVLLHEIGNHIELNFVVNCCYCSFA